MQDLPLGYLDSNIAHVHGCASIINDININDQVIHRSNDLDRQSYKWNRLQSLNSVPELTLAFVYLCNVQVFYTGQQSIRQWKLLQRHHFDLKKITVVREIFGNNYFWRLLLQQKFPVTIVNIKLTSKDRSYDHQIIRKIVLANIKTMSMESSFPLPYQGSGL